LACVPVEKKLSACIEENGGGANAASRVTAQRGCREQMLYLESL